MSMLTLAERNPSRRKTHPSKRHPKNSSEPRRLWETKKRSYRKWSKNMVKSKEKIKRSKRMSLSKTKTSNKVWRISKTAWERQRMSWRERMINLSNQSPRPGGLRTRWNLTLTLLKARRIPISNWRPRWGNKRQRRKSLKRKTPPRQPQWSKSKWKLSLPQSERNQKRWKRSPRWSLPSRSSYWLLSLLREKSCAVMISLQWCLPEKRVSKCW